MKKDFGAQTVCYPMAVFIVGTYDENGVPDAMNAAWGGISNDNEISLCLAPVHKTVKNLKKTKAFTVAMGTVDTLVSCDYVGIVSGNNTPDKMKKSGFTAEKSTHVNAPVFKELPMVLECEVLSFDDASCRLVGKIVNVAADESVLTNGKIDPAKLHPLIFDPVNQKYLVAEKVVGNAFSDGKKLVK
jgi:flavin reductase (DIM6/NTAB) family NADH-FMN oxidoreductase RutF